MDADTTYSEQLTKRILARAVELDHIRSANYSLTDLRSIAAEVGVSDGALEQAIREQQTARTLQAVTPTDVRGGRSFLLPLMGATAVIGAASGLVDSTTIYITSAFAMSVLLLLSGGLAVSEDYSKPWRGWLRIQFKNTLLWTAYTATWLIAASSAEIPREFAMGMMFRVVVLGWGLSSVFATVVAAARRWRQPPAVKGVGGDATPPLRRRVADKLKSWIDLWARRTRVEPITRDRAAHATPAH